jgi:hypothetical protein
MKLGRRKFLQNRWLSLIDQPDGSVIPSVNVTALHGVLSTLKLKETGDMEQARAVRNPDEASRLEQEILEGDPKYCI